MKDLPNGFTGYRAIRPNGSDDARSERQRQAAGQPMQAGASTQGRPRMEDAAFDSEELDAIPQTDQRWAWVEVDLAAIRRNIVEVRRGLRPRTKLAVVVRGDAYGHGAVEVSKAVLGAGADRLVVGTVPEALELRRAGITAPILLVDQPPAQSAPLLLANHITPTVYDQDFAIAYGEVADLHGMQAPFHLAVNTGMNRIGVHYDDAVEFLRQIEFHRALTMEGVFTQFATAENAESFDFDIQARRFAESLENMHNAGFELGIIHCTDTAAMLRYPGVQFDMVRVGGAVYGLHPCPETHELIQLRPAMSVHARITDMRSVPVSEGVSYGFQYRSPGSVMICTIPVGYGDGLQRGLSGNTDFVMGGRYYRQVGAICMDQSMFEVDMRARDRIDPHVGDEVLVVGTQGIAQITLDEMAEKLGTISYEIATGFGMRLPRIYR